MAVGEEDQKCGKPEKKAQDIERRQREKADRVGPLKVGIEKVRGE